VYCISSVQRLYTCSTQALSGPQRIFFLISILQFSNRIEL
jgi:hypothetical protein